MMWRDRFRSFRTNGGIVFRRVLAMVVVFLLAGCAPTPMPLPVNPYMARNLGVMVSGRVVLASVQIRTVAGVVDVDSAGICVDGGTDFPMGGQTFTESWQTVSSTRSFPAGQYTARACVTDGGHSQSVSGDAVTFTVR